MTSEAFARVFAMLRAGRGPDEAFRPYLLSCVRRGCIDQATRTQRLLPLERAVDADHSVRGEDELDRRTESELMACAFTSLPQRWRQVLWLTEVEHRRHDDVGARLGLAPAAVAALAARARQGLSTAYLRAHLGDSRRSRRLPVAERLPAFVRGSASVSDSTPVRGPPRPMLFVSKPPNTNCTTSTRHCARCRSPCSSVSARLRPPSGRGWLARLLARLGRGGGTASGVPGATAGGRRPARSVGSQSVERGGLGALATASAVAAMVLVPSLALASDAQSGSAFTNPAAVRLHAPTSAATGSTARPTAAGGGPGGTRRGGQPQPVERHRRRAGARCRGGERRRPGRAPPTRSPAPAISGASSQLAPPTISLPGISLPGILPLPGHALPGIAVPSLGASARRAAVAVHPGDLAAPAAPPDPSPRPAAGASRSRR